MVIIKPPFRFFDDSKFNIFLAGTIDQGNSVDWQEKFVYNLEDTGHINKCTIYNPRRDEWDDSWEQSKANPLFNDQVSWELEYLERANLIVLYLLPGSQSPISLLELGLHARNKRMVVVCPDGFWRKGNVDIVCERYGVKMFDTIDDVISHMVNEHLTAWQE